MKIALSMLEIQSLEMKRVLLEEFYMDLFLIIDVFSQTVYLTNYTYIYKRKKTKCPDRH